MKDRVASLLVPLLLAVALLYQVLSDLQIALTHPATLTIIGTLVAVAVLTGLLAAFGPMVVRVVVLSICAVLFLDVTFHLSGVFEGLNPEIRARIERDEQRITDLHRIQAALERYVDEVGPPPTPMEYGQGVGPDNWWKGWWDVSSDSGFMDFLAVSGVLQAVPRDPENLAPVPADPRSGRQYVYFVVPPRYGYNGGACEPERSHYLLAVTDLESESSRPTRTFTGSGCGCLWRDTPNFFDHHFDYLICGSFGDAASGQLVDQDGGSPEVHLATDKKRVSDLLEINRLIQSYLKNVGPLPLPLEYGEAEQSRGPGFWQHQWDVSAEDGDGDGVFFLDFLIDGGEASQVPVDPANRKSPDGDPRGGRQFVYLLVPPGTDYAGGPVAAGPNTWHYLLGITDLESETDRPPAGFAGSGCMPLWRDAPDYFKNHFDYIVCDRFEATPQDRMRANAILRERAASHGQRRVNPDAKGD